MSETILLPIKSADQPVEGRAIVRGLLALHRGLDTNADWKPALNGDSWTLTHLPTGVALLSEMPAAVGRRALRTLHRLHLWEPLRPKGVTVDFWRELHTRGFDRYLVVSGIMDTLRGWGFVFTPSYGGAAGWCGWRVDTPHGRCEMLESNLELVIYAYGVRDGHQAAKRGL